MHSEIAIQEIAITRYAVYSKGDPIGSSNKEPMKEESAGVSEIVVSASKKKTLTSTDIIALEGVMSHQCDQTDLYRIKQQRLGKSKRKTRALGNQFAI